MDDEEIFDLPPGWSYAGYTGTDVGRIKVKYVKLNDRRPAEVIYGGNRKWLLRLGLYNDTVYLSPKAAIMAYEMLYG